MEKFLITYPRSSTNLVEQNDRGHFGVQSLLVSGTEKTPSGAAGRRMSTSQ